jgi:ATP-dependent RNA helicase RhlE
MSFKSLGLKDALLRAVEKKGYTEPSPIQEKAIPPILNKRDVLASAQTGTGKTAGFTLPMLQLLAREQPRGKRHIRALIVTPTRELAAQILEEVKDYSKFLEIKSTVIFGGVKQHKQVAALEKGVDILVATPGRLLDLIGQGFISLQQIEFFVLDEADRMLDMGFLRDIKKIMNQMPNKRQNLMFSATFSNDIKKLANTILVNPVRVNATPENTTSELVKHKVYKVDQKKKTELLVKLILEQGWWQILIFTRTKHRANRLAQQLEKKKISAMAIHGNKSQGARTKALAAFKRGDVSTLVATDIAARGLDIPLLPHVINFELPNVPEDYVHRIGRTGRAGSDGEAISLVDASELTYLKDIEKLLKQQIPWEVVEGFEPSRGPVPGGKKKSKQRNQQSNQPRKDNKPTQGNKQNNSGYKQSGDSDRPKKNFNDGPRRERPDNSTSENRPKKSKNDYWKKKKFNQKKKRGGPDNRHSDR